MNIGPCACCCFFITIVIIIADIVLALCIRFALPKYITHDGYLPAQGGKIKYDVAIKMCPCLAKIYPEGTKGVITIPVLKDSKKNQKRKSKGKEKRQIADTDSKQLTMYSYVVSLSMPTYSDDLEEKHFACNGLIQNSYWLVTSKICVKDESEWYNLTIRSNSEFWSKQGEEHRVVNVSYMTNDLVALKVSPKFTDRLIPSPAIKVSTLNRKWLYAVELGWDDNIYLKTSLRYKYSYFHVNEWTTNSCNESEPSEICPKSVNCTRITSIPLVTSCHELIGLKFTEMEQCGFYNLAMISGNLENVSKVQNCYEINRDMCPSLGNIIDIC